MRAKKFLDFWIFSEYLPNSTCRTVTRPQPQAMPVLRAAFSLPVADAQRTERFYSGIFAAEMVSREAGGEPCGQAVPYPWGLAAYFKDPDGHLWEVLWHSGK